MFEQYPTLLVTKLYIPRLRSSQISRPSLLAALNEGLDYKLTLIAAAAGFGKTTLLADWSHRSALDVGWFSLDEGDNDPVRFLSYLIAAVQTRHPHIGVELLSALQSPQPPSPENVVHSLINQLASLTGRFVLVLDDYHVIENPTIHSALTLLIDYLPPQTNVVLLTRADPPLPLARWRAKHELLELRAAALRFSQEEVQRFLNETMRLELSTEDAIALDKRTEGWVAGIQLAAVAMQPLQNARQTFIETFSGSHRFVLDYLLEEVLAHQTEDVRHFLLQTSILSRLNAPLCSAVTGESNGQMLQQLEANNLFLIPLDSTGYWYRYHHLFADLLRARLQAECSSETIRHLHLNAALWHEQNGFPEEAVVYALDGQDFDYASQLILGAAVGVSRRSEVTMLLEWYRAFPPDFIAGQPRLALQFGTAFALNGRWHEAETILSIVEEQQSKVSQDDLLMLSYLVASNRHDKLRLTAITAQAAANPHPEPVVKLVQGLVVSLSGNLTLACQLLAEAQAASEHRGDQSLALSALFHQCRFHVFLGNLRQAYELSQQSLQRAEAIGAAATPLVALAHVSLGRILIEWNEVETASLHLQQAVRLSELSGFVTGMISSVTMMLAEVEQARGNMDGALETAKSALAYAERFDPASEVTWLGIYQVRLWLAQENITAASEWWRGSDYPTLPASMFYPATIHLVTQARLLLAQRKTEASIALLTQLLNAPSNLFTVEMLAVLALARVAHGDSVNSLLTLEQALTLANAEKRIRIFLELGQPMLKLLTRFCEGAASQRPDYEFARKLLSLFPSQAEKSASLEALSDRELEVLRLITAGYSNEEIARSLTIALSTVKWYVNTLYSKLHVKTRSQAIAYVHEHKLFND